MIRVTVPPRNPTQAQQNPSPFALGVLELERAPRAYLILVTCPWIPCAHPALHYNYVYFQEAGPMKNTAILLVQCPDRKGLDATIAEFIYRHDGNILHFEQHQAGQERFYLARIEWDLDGFQLNLTEFPEKFAPVAEKFAMKWRVAPGNYRPRVAIFVSRYDHCLV